VEDNPSILRPLPEPATCSFSTGVDVPIPTFCENKLGESITLKEINSK
jgi:hypothetical protein